MFGSSAIGCVWADQLTQNEIPQGLTHENTAHNNIRKEMDSTTWWLSCRIPYLEGWLVYPYDDWRGVYCTIYRYLWYVLLSSLNIVPYNLEDFQLAKTLHHIQEHGSGYWNVTLLRQGCLAPSPDVISTVYSLRTLELYRRLRLRHPQISVQAFVKVICDLHNVSQYLKLSISRSDTLCRYLIVDHSGMAWQTSLMSTSKFIAV